MGIRTEDIPELKARRDAMRKQHLAHESHGKHKDKSFDQLSKKEKEELLKLIALRLGLIKEDDAEMS